MENDGCRIIHIRFVRLLHFPLHSFGLRGVAAKYDFLLGMRDYRSQVVDDQEIVEALDTQDPIFVRPRAMQPRFSGFIGEFELFLWNAQTDRYPCLISSSAVGS